MHFSIPDTQEFVDGAGNAYIVSINTFYYVYCVLNYLYNNMTSPEL